MNERIKELAEQAGLESFYVEYSPWQVEFEKFAELIVAECMRVVGNPTCPNYAYQAIQKHFGVKE